jgi:transposase-like protein
MYSFGMTDRDIKSHLEQIYNVDVSPDLISRVTHAVLEEVREWQNRPLESRYAIVYLDALRVKSRQDGKSCTKSVYVALGVNFEGQKEVLGLWISENEGAKFWMGVLNELKNRGVEDILIACMDGLTGFPEALRAVYPQTRVQLCIIHTIPRGLFRTRTFGNYVLISRRFIPLPLRKPAVPPWKSSGKNGMTSIR